MIYFLNLRMLVQILYNLQCILHMPLHPQGQGFQSLKKNESMERGQGGSGIPEQYRADTRYKSRRTRGFCEADPMIACVGFGKAWKFTACFPVKSSAVNDDASDRGSVSADEFRCGMYHDIGAIFNRTDQIRSGKGIVYHQRDSMCMGDNRQLFNIRYVRIGIAQGFYVDRFCIILDRRFHFFILKGIYEGGCNSVFRQGMRQKIIRSAVNIFRSHNVISRMRQILKRIGNRRCAGCHRKRRRAAFQSRNSFFEHIRRGIRQPSVNIPGV